MFNSNQEVGEKVSPNEIKSSNIFEDFSQDSALKKEIEIIDASEGKDMYFYFKKISFFLKFGNFLLFVILSIFILYSFFQQKEDLEPYTFLSPICNLFLGSATPKDGNCYSVTSYFESIQKQYDTETSLQVSIISDLIGDVFEIQNFTYSRIVSFLLEKTKNRLRPTNIISDFDNIKSKFEPVDKLKVECYNITVNDTYELTANCDAYSSDWDTNIVKLEDGVVVKNPNGGTSLSIASSFIDFIDSHPDSKFSSTEKQKIFVSENILGKGAFTKKTPFTLRLQYSSENNLTY